MKRLLLLFVVLTGLSRAQTCGNLNFETGNLSGWTVTSGTVTGVGSASVMTGCCAAPGSPEATVITTPIFTGYLGYLPNSPFGGTKVLKLNDSLATNNSGLVSRATFTLVVSPTTTLFQYAIASLISGMGHPCGDAAYANVRIKDNSSAIIHNNHFEPSTTTSVNCGNSTAFTSTLNNVASFCWTTYSISLAAYIGTSVTIEVTAGDCTGWGHAGYCFFDASCTGLPPATVNCSAPSAINETIVNATEVNVFPNPAKDNLHINLNSPVNAELFIYDAVGKIVMHKKELQNENSISIKNFNQGLYFYTIVQNNKSIKTGKIIKE